MDKRFIYLDTDTKPRQYIQEVARIVFDKMWRDLEDKPFGEIDVNVAASNWLYAKGVIHTCKVMLKWTRDEINAYRHGRKFRGRYLARYSGK